MADLFVVRLTHSGLDGLEKDLRAMPVQSARLFEVSVRHAAQAGNKAARKLARVSAGAHGRHYFKAFTAERIKRHSWEYGPDSARPQGGMSFEFGSRNQKPHLDLARSAGPAREDLARRIGNDLDKLFW